MALVDTGSQVSTLTEGLSSEFGLKILPLWGLFCLEETRGIAIPYKGYIETNLILPGLPRYNEDMFIPVILDKKYGKRVSVQISTLVIHHFVTTMQKNYYSKGIS